MNQNTIDSFKKIGLEDSILISRCIDNENIRFAYETYHLLSKDQQDEFKEDMLTAITEMTDKTPPPK